MYQGLEGLEMIRLEGVDGWWDRLVDWRASIAGHKKIPRKVVAEEFNMWIPIS